MKNKIKILLISLSMVLIPLGTYAASDLSSSDGYQQYSYACPNGYSRSDCPYYKKQDRFNEKGYYREGRHHGRGHHHRGYFN